MVVAVAVAVLLADAELAALEQAAPKMIIPRSMNEINLRMLFLSINHLLFDESYILKNGEELPNHAGSNHAYSRR